MAVMLGKQLGAPGYIPRSHAKFKSQAFLKLLTRGLGTQGQVDPWGSVASDPSPQREFQARHLRDNNQGYPLASIYKYTHMNTHN